MDSRTVDIKTAAGLLQVSVQRVHQMIREDRLPGAYKAGGAWRIPRTAHAALAPARPQSRMEAAAELAAVAKPKLDEAVRRAGLIAECEAFCGQMVRSGFGSREAIEGFCRQRGIAVRTMYRWMKAFRQRGITGLVDKRGGVSEGDTVTPEAWDRFCAMYLTPQQLSVKVCWQNVCYLNTSQDLAWNIPSLRRMQQLVQEKIPYPVLVLHREGKAAWEAKCAPYIQTDMDSIEPGAVWIGDHHEFDCWVRHRGKWIRPWITAWEDMRSRALVGWTITAAPNSSTILQAFRAAALEYGPPDSVKIDNGKDYDSEMFTGTTKQRRRLKDVNVDEETVAGLYAMMNIVVSFAQPYHPQSKAVERWFDTLEGQFVKTMPTYCGKDTHRRPEDLFDYMKTDKAIQEAMELEEFAEMCGQYLSVYNRTAHAGRGMEGRSPLDVLSLRASRRVLADGVLDLLCRIWTGKLRVGKNGVRIRGLWYGQFDATLMAYQGKDVRCAYDPEDITRIWVYEEATYKLITVAEQAKLIAYGAGADDESLREAMASKNRARKIIKNYRKAAQTANTDLTSLTIAAAAAKAKPAPEQPKQSLRPVATVLDSQVAEHQRQLNIKMVRRAAGAESTTSVPDLRLNLGGSNRGSELPDIDLGINLGKKSQRKDVNLRLFER